MVALVVFSAAQPLCSPEALRYQGLDRIDTQGQDAQTR